MTATTSTYRLGPVDQIPPGEGRAFAVGGAQVAVFHLRSGAVRAVSAICTHSGGPIADGQADEHVVVCPLHLHAFDLVTGCSKSGPEPLTVYEVRVEAGELVIEC